MKVSIVIPVYNVKAYLEKCIASVLELKSETEVILVDDGSTDGSGELCDLWADKDSRIKGIHQKNGGLSAARNAGIQVSTGEYILFLDADDFLDPDETDRMLAYLQEKPQVLMGLYRNYYGEDENMEQEDSPVFFLMKGKVPIDEFLHTIPGDGMSCYMIACRFVVQRELILKDHLFFCQGIYHEDEEWTSRLFCSIDSIYISHCFFYQYRRKRKGSITLGIGKKHILDCLFIMKKINMLLEDRDLSTEKQQYFEKRMAQLFLNIVLNFYVLDRPERKQLYGELKKFRKNCVSNMSGKIGNIVKIFTRVAGIHTTAFLLMIVKKMRGCRERSSYRVVNSSSK